MAVPGVNKTGQWEGRSRLRNLKTGQQSTVFTFMFRVKMPQGERSSCLAIVHRDAEASNRLRESLTEAQARKNSILESSLDPIITINHEGVIIEFNRAAEQTFGHSREKVLGTRPSDVLFPPSLSAEHRSRIERYLEAGEGSMLGKRVEVTASRTNGEVFHAEMAMTIGQINGAPVLTFFVRDISARKKAEEEQARYAAELERSNRDLEQFAYVASHDLQEPLRKIRAFGDRLEVKCKDLLDETAQECVSRMQNAAARMQELIEGPVDAFPRHLAGPRFRAGRSGRDRAAGGGRPGSADRARARAGGGGQAADDPGRTAANPPVAAEPDRQRPEIPPPRRASDREDRGPLRAAARPAAVAEIAGRGEVPHHGRGQRHRFRPAICRADLRHFPAAASPRRLRRDGHRAGHLPADRRVSRRPDFGPEHARQGFDLRSAAAGGPGEKETHRGASDGEQARALHDPHGRRRCRRLPPGSRGVAGVEAAARPADRPRRPAVAGLPAAAGRVSSSRPTSRGPT